jgi:hypothetical protein
MKLLSILALALALSGCSTIKLNCPSDHVVTANLNGPNIATVAAQLAAIIGPLTATSLAMKNGAVLTPTTTTNDGTLAVNTLDIVGTQSYSCGNAAATK